MLISQRIAKDARFLQSYSDLKEDQIILAGIRADVISAIKFLVEDHILGTKENDDPTFEEINAQILNATTPQNQEKRQALHYQFSVPSFDTMLLESAVICLLIKRLTDHPCGWSCCIISENGRIATYNARVLMDADRKLPRLQFDCFSPRIKKNFEFNMNHESAALRAKTAALVHHAISFAKVFALFACETLMFINTSNVQRHLYVPTKKENAGVPKVLLSKFQYHVLDIYRERKSYVSLEDISDHLWKAHEHKKGRAHLVRGHFKKINEKLYWWNPFVRNAKNADTVGAVYKDYHIKKD